MISKNKFHIMAAVIAAISFFGFIFVNQAFAKISIVEVMYDAKGTDTDKEWVKIVNDNESDYDISKIKLTINGSNHLVKDPNGSTVINKGDSIILADNPDNFKINYPNYNGKLFDSVVSLTNTSGTVAINYNDTLIDSMSYDSSMGASGDGNSLQKIDNVWKAETPTIGFPEDYEPTQNPPATTTPDNSDDSGDASTTSTTSATSTATTTVITKIVYVSSHASPEDLSDLEITPAFEISAGRERTASVGAPVQFSAKYSASQDLSIYPQIFDWSFGDGTSASGKDISHIYKYHGDYTVILNGTCNGIDSVSRTTVHALSPDVSIIAILNGDVQIMDNSDTEINLGNWKLKDLSGEFIFPADTIVLPGKSIILSNEDTKIKAGTNDKLYLYNPSGGQVAFANFSNNEFPSASSSEVLSGIVEDNLNSTVEKAEALVSLLKKYNASFPIKNIQTAKASATAITSISLGDGNLLPQKQNMAQTASAAESLNFSAAATTSRGFWARFKEFFHL